LSIQFLTQLGSFHPERNAVQVFRLRCYSGREESRSEKIEMEQGMRLQRLLQVRWVVRFGALLLLLGAAGLIEGHAVLKESSPAANSVVTGPDVPITLKYNVRIDAARSKVQLLHPDNSVTELAVEKQTSPDTLTLKAKGLVPGAYKIQWQVLAPDGHITRGEIPFTVKGS
jgi:hypothetical protein